MLIRIEMEADFVNLECDKCGCLLNEVEDRFIDSNDHEVMTLLCSDCYEAYCEEEKDNARD